MKSSRTSITLGYTEPIEIEEGVYENRQIEKKVKAEEINVFQARRDRYFADQLTLTARFEIRSGLLPDTTLNYVIWKGRKYKVNNATPNTDDHYAIIEIGELI